MTIILWPVARPPVDHSVPCQVSLYTLVILSGAKNLGPLGYVGDERQRREICTVHPHRDLFSLIHPVLFQGLYELKLAVRQVRMCQILRVMMKVNNTRDASAAASA